MGHGGKTEAAILLGNDHSEKAVALQKVPGFRVQVSIVVGDLPGVQHVTQFLDRAVEVRLLFNRQGQVGLLFEQFPVRPAGEQFAFPANCSSVQRNLFRFGNVGKHAPKLLEERRADQLLAPGNNVKRNRDDRKDRGDHRQAEHGHRPGRGQDYNARGHGYGPHQQAGAVESTDKCNSQKS